MLSDLARAFMEQALAHQDISAAAFHWGNDQEFAEQLLADAVLHGCTADSLFDGRSVEEALSIYMDEE